MPVVVALKYSNAEFGAETGYIGGIAERVRNLSDAQIKDRLGAIKETSILRNLAQDMCYDSNVCKQAGAQYTRMNQSDYDRIRLVALWYMTDLPSYTRRIADSFN